MCFSFTSVGPGVVVERPRAAFLDTMSSRPRKKQRETVKATYAYESGEGVSGAATAIDADDSDDDEEMELPVEGGTVDQQLGAILHGSSDLEIFTILSQVPDLDDGIKLIVGMQKLSRDANSFALLRPLADACTNEGMAFLYNKIGGLTDDQVAADIANVFSGEPDTVTSLMKQPAEMRRRNFFMNLAAGYLDTDES